MLRPLTEQDIPYLLGIEQATQSTPWSEDIFKSCMQAGYEGWVIEDNHFVIGFIIFSIQLNESHILNLGVHPNFQRLGFGHQLMSHALNESKKDGVSVAYLEVRSSNNPAIALYKKMGFKQIGTRRDYYPATTGREDALVFAKDVATL
jgi:ribosomal-protein-alanine N-acetyltransferase